MSSRVAPSRACSSRALSLDRVSRALASTVWADWHAIYSTNTLKVQISARLWNCSRVILDDSNASDHRSYSRSTPIDTKRDQSTPIDSNRHRSNSRHTEWKARMVSCEQRTLTAVDWRTLTAVYPFSLQCTDARWRTLTHVDVLCCLPVSAVDAPCVALSQCSTHRRLKRIQTRQRWTWCTFNIYCMKTWIQLGALCHICWDEGSL